MTRPRRTIGSRAARAAQRLERHTLALGIVVLALMAAMTYVSIIAINGVPFSDTYRVKLTVPADAPLLKDGDEVRVAGQRAGQVRRVERADGGGTLLTVELDEGPIGRDARAAVRLRGLAGSVYVAITRGDVSRPLPEDGVLPLARSGAGVELTDVLAGFDADTRRVLARTLEAYGNGLRGRGPELNRALGDLDPALRDLQPLLRALRPQPGALAAALRSMAGTTRAFARPGARELEPLLRASSGAGAAIAQERRALGAAIDELRPFEDAALRTLPLADLLLGDAASASRALAPAVRRLAAALPEVDRLLAQRPELAELPRLARAARPVLAPAGPLLIELRPTAGLLAPLANPLDSLAVHLAPYERELFLAPDGFVRWGQFTYPDGQAPGHRAVRFAPVFTCHRGRTPYPKPGEALEHSQECDS